MNKFQFLLLAFVLTFTISCGQQKRYVSYKIKKGETLRDIANRLDIKTKDLLRLNPDVGRKPAANTVIIIPSKKKKNSASNTTKYAIVKDDEHRNSDTQKEDKATNSSLSDGVQTTFKQTIYEYETHTVQAGETVYRITKKYSISKDDLIKWNPNYPNIEKNVLSVGDVLNVNAIEKLVTIDREDVLEKFLTHTVKSKETVYSITRFYNISKEELVRLNPEYSKIANNQVSVGQLLKIKPIEQVNSSDNYAFYKDNIEENTAINLTVLLPFKAHDYKITETNDIFNQEKNSSAKLANMVTDFYMGLEMAVDSIKKQGVNVQANIFDTGDRGKNITSILDQDKLKNTDVVIGPFYSDKAEIIASKVNVPILFPHFSSNQDQFSKEKLIKTAPDKQSYSNYLVSYLKETYKGQQIFVVGDGKVTSNRIINKIVPQLKSHDSIEKIHVLKPTKGYIEKTLFTSKMIPKKDHWIIMTSDDNVVVANVLNSMISIPDDIKVQVFSVEKYNAYNKIENNKLANIHFTYVSNSFTDYTSEEVKIFNKKYYKKNNTIPSDYAIKGFDITYDILMRLASGNDLLTTFKQGVSLRLENKFDYKQSSGSTSNRGLFIVKYNQDLSLIRLK